MRYFLQIAYKGSHYHGWQVQPNAHSVQAEMDNALSALFSERIHVTGCGRTDAGVHASDFYLHFDAPKEPHRQLVYKLNKMLPPDIAVYRLLPVEEKAHSRFDATEREYQYYLHFQKDPFLTGLSFYYPYPRPDIALMNEAAELLLNYEDFAPFCKAGHGAKTTLCDVRHARWEELDNNRWRFTIRADRFLRGMVRLVVGACLQAGRKKISVDDVKQVMEESGKFRYLHSVAANGLFLSAVKYPYL